MSESAAIITRLLDKIDQLECQVRDLRARLTGETLRLPPPSPAENTPQPLTRREIEIARLICQGLTSEAIASRLVTQPNTIKKHRSHIRAKLGVSDREGLEALRETWDTLP